MKLVLGCKECWLPEVVKPREKLPDDLDDDAASCVSLCHLFMKSRAIGRRWIEETRAAEDTEGFLSTIAVLMSLSIAWTLVAWLMSALQLKFPVNVRL